MERARPRPTAPQSPAPGAIAEEVVMSPLARPLGSVLLIASLILLAPVARSDELPVADGVERQPLVAQARRVAEALDWLGEPLTEQTLARLRQAESMDDPAASGRAIQEVLDAACLIGVRIDPERKVSA